MRYFVGFLVAIGFIVLVFILILKSVGGGNSNQPKPLDLNSFSNTNAVVQLTIDGPISADQTHQAAQITIGQSESSIQILRGYQGTVTASKTYDNNPASYNVLLHALTLSGYNNGNSDPKLKDETGYCPDGDRYVFEVIRDNSPVQHLWATSCGRQGNYKGNVTQTLDLFERQIPDYDELTGSVDI